MRKGFIEKGKNSFASPNHPFPKPAQYSREPMSFLVGKGKAKSSFILTSLGGALGKRPASVAPHPEH